jgi:hypothetical protein
MAAIIVSNILDLLSPFSLNVRPVVCILPSYLVFIIAVQQHYTLTAALAQYDACMRRYFDRDPAYRTVQAPAMSEQRIPETQFAEPVMGKKAG